MLRKYIYLLIILLGGFCIYNVYNKKDVSNVRGGPCEYVEYSGLCEITNIDKDSAQENEYESFEVNYIFSLENSTDINKMEFPSAVDIANGKNMNLTYINGWNVGEEFIQKYSLNPNNRYPCVLKEIIQGTCTSVIVEFLSVDRADYADLN